MSTGTKIQLHEARAVAAHIYTRLLKDVFAQIKVVGSIRREKEWVGDIEIAVMPKVDMVPMDSQRLFGSTIEHRPINRLLERLDQLAHAGDILPHDGREFTIPHRAANEDLTIRPHKCWEGQRLRRFHLPDCIAPVELFIADSSGSNWGPTVAIRTGPQDFSTMLVSRLRAGGVYEQADGYVKYLSGPAKGEVRHCPTEEEYFQLCRINGVPAPHARHSFREPRP